ncbi:MAG: hypothetical protein M3441_06385 [Chloroflexota bacterium]|nr:hypothetical protein [Chloroflexota bacterium]
MLPKKTMRLGLVLAATLLIVTDLAAIKLPGIAVAQTQIIPQNACWAVSTFPVSGEDRIAEAHIEDMAATAEGQVWAAGWIRGRNNVNKPVLLRWEGADWSQVQVPALEGEVRLYALKAFASNDIWVLGVKYEPMPPEATPRQSHALLLHWNGTAWTKAPDLMLLEEGSSPELKELDGTGPDDLWAVGYYSIPAQPPRGATLAQRILITHWDGSAWQQVPTRDVPGLEFDPRNPTDSYLTDVSASSRDNVWITGRGGHGGLMIKWDGKEIAPIIRSGFEQIYDLNHVLTFSKDEVWAFGKDTKNRTFVAIRSTPGGWSSTEIPFLQSLKTEYPDLAVVKATSSSDIWLAGEYYMRDAARRDTYKSFTAHWNGTKWSIETDQLVLEHLNIESGALVGEHVWLGGTTRDSLGTPVTALFLRGPKTPCGAIEPGIPRGPLPPPAALPGANRRLFPETQKTVTGIFLDYWNEHGGIAQQGYPVSELATEKSILDGKVYTVQYFERAVFEYHPENQPPHNVLLSQLGTFRYKEKYLENAPNQVPNNEPNSVLFPETGRRLGGVFREYWVKNGGLAQQGLPISDEFVEVSDLDNRPYKVQYFERAVFEYHPENKPPYDVLLSQLGTFRYRAAGHQASRHPSTPVFTAQYAYPVVVSGRYIFWSDTQDQTLPGRVSVHGYDVERGERFEVSRRSSYKDLATDGKTVVWQERMEDPGRPGIFLNNLYGYDIATRKEFAIIETKLPSEFQPTLFHPVVDGDTVYYGDARRQHTGLYARSLSTGNETKIADVVFGAEGGEGVLVWSVAGQPNRLHVFRPRAQPAKTIIDIGEGFDPLEGFSLSGNKVVWSTTQGEIFVYDLLANTRQKIAVGGAPRPVIRGSIVMWSERLTPPGAKPSHWSIKAHDLQTGKSWTVVARSENALVVEGLLDGERVVYREHAGRVIQLFMVPLGRIN